MRFPKAQLATGGRHVPRCISEIVTVGTSLVPRTPRSLAKVLGSFARGVVFNHRTYGWIFFEVATQTPEACIGHCATLGIVNRSDTKLLVDGSNVNKTKSHPLC